MTKRRFFTPAEASAIRDFLDLEAVSSVVDAGYLGRVLHARTARNANPHDAEAELPHGDVETKRPGRPRPREG